MKNLTEIVDELDLDKNSMDIIQSRWYPMRTRLMRMKKHAWCAPRELRLRAPLCSLVCQPAVRRPFGLIPEAEEEEERA